ncbi:MAG: hypothetical protein M3Y69_03995, partial [Verrucomicrobiota bacterium]|nr:hypothetical protein [Verrucomicrobiota bacterium]
NEPPNPTEYLSEPPEMTSQRREAKEGQNKKGTSVMKKEIKRISLMAAIFLTVALASSTAQAGVIRINGTFAGTEIGTPFPNPAEGSYANGSVTSTDTQLGPFKLFYSLIVDFAFLGKFPGAPGASQMVVGDAANGDSILTCFFGNGAGDFCSPGVLHVGSTHTVIGGTGRYAGASGSYTLDQCVSFAPGGETSGTIRGTIVVRGRAER